VRRITTNRKNYTKSYQGSTSHYTAKLMGFFNLIVYRYLKTFIIMEIIYTEEKSLNKELKNIIKINFEKNVKVKQITPSKIVIKNSLEKRVGVFEKNEKGFFNLIKF